MLLQIVLPERMTTVVGRIGGILKMMTQAVMMTRVRMMAVK
jgi:hypothetical protein